MQHRGRITSTALLVAVIALAACDGGDAVDDRLNPDGESVIDEDIDDDTVITDPGGLTNSLDGNDGDIEDKGAVVDDD